MYVLCRNGHWFRGNACPIDGYYDDFVDQIIQATEKLRDRSEPLTLSSLANEADISGNILRRILIVEAIDDSPECFVVP